MEDQGEASQIIKEEAGQIVNTDTREGRDYHLADLKSRAKKLIKNVSVKTHEAANHIDVCERELQALRREFYSLELQVDNCTRGSRSEGNQFCSYVELANVMDILADVQTSIWTFYANRAGEIDELRHRKLLLRDVIQMVEALPVFENHLDEDFNCEICCGSWDEEEDRDLPLCHLPYHEGITLHRVCLQTEFKYIATINYQAYELTNEITKQKMIYEADRENRANDFAFQLYMSVRVFQSLWQNFLQYESAVDYCTCANPSSECNTYRDPLKKVGHIFMEIIFLMKQCLFDGFLKEREERELERKLMQVVEGFPPIRITDNHVNQKAVCVICLNIFEVAEEPCHLPCNEGHLFHRNCIQDWIKTKNECPICRKPAYRQKQSVYSATMARLDSFCLVLISHFRRDGEFDRMNTL